MISKIFGIIGDPIDHSLSPQMFNSFFQKKNLPHLYLRFHLKKKDLGRFVKKCRGWGLVGFNVTIPHKESILPFLDKIDPAVKIIGAANTVVVRGNRLIGYNTDAEGYSLSLRRETGFEPRGKSILVIGAGGASRAILYTLGRHGARQIFLTNRTRSKALRLCDEFKRHFPKTAFKVVRFHPTDLAPLFPKIDLLINTTSVGLKGTGFKNLPPLLFLHSKAIVSDIVYRPLITHLLKEAKRCHLKTHGGLGMLLHQAVLAYRIWTGKKALLDAPKVS
ncbi:MAG: shikimate dehydrogenase [Deltaproteobacteria bacterium]|nr:shikimate dehydrogenase [Deltaproteobacteria bacterium]